MLRFLAVAALVAVLMPLPVFAQDGTMSLEEELAALRRELARPEVDENTWVERTPDLAILSTAEVKGEVAPCG